MRTIVLMNQKGGVGKTTTSVNVAAGLARQGQRVCLFDLDPQGHASLHVGVEAFGDALSVYDVFIGEAKLSEVRRLASDNLWVVPANVDLAAAELELADAPNRELILRNAIAELQATDPFDVIIMDCPPSLSVLTINALSAADEVMIPLQPHFLALQGLSKLLETTALVTRRLNPKLRVTGIMMCMFDAGTRLAADVMDDLTMFLEASEPEAPWADAKIFETRIRRNIKLAEAPSFGVSIFDYAAKSNGSEDYGLLVAEILAMDQRLSAAA